MLEFGASVTRTFRQLPKYQWRNRQSKQRETQRIHLRIVPVVQKIENTQRQRLAPRRLNQDDGFHVPQAEQINHIPRRGQLRARFAASERDGTIASATRLRPALHLSGRSQQIAARAQLRSTQRPSSGQQKQKSQSQRFGKT